MAIDALSSVPLGRSDTGEAVVLGKGNFEDFTGNILKIRAKEGEERKQTNAEIGKLLQDQVQSKWAKDNIDIFQPRMQAIKDKTLELYKEKKGRLNSVDLYGIQSEWNKLKAEADASNSLYAENEKAIQQLREDPKGEKFDIEQSSLIRQKFADPMSDPELKQEVINQYGGDVIKWRANNAARFANVASYNVNDDLTKGFKDKLSKEYVRDANGNIKMTQGKGGVLIGEFKEGIDRDKIKTHYDTFWNRTDYAGKKFRKQAEDKVDTEFVISDDGKVTPMTEEALLIFQKTPNLKNRSKSEIKSILAKEVGLHQTESLFPTKEGIFTEKPINIKVNNASGGGKQYDKFNWAVGNNSIPATKEDAGTTFGKFRAWFQSTGKQTRPYVSVSAKSASDNPSLTINQQQVIPQGFYKNKEGEWVLVSDKEQRIASNGFATEPGDKQEFKPLEINLGKDDKTSVEVAGKYGFDTPEELFKFLDKKAGQKSTPSPSNKPTGTGKKKLPGT